MWAVARSKTARATVALGPAVTRSPTYVTTDGTTVTSSQLYDRDPSSYLPSHLYFLATQGNRPQF